MTYTALMDATEAAEMALDPAACAAELAELIATPRPDDTEA